MTLGVSADGDLIFNAYRASAKVRNIEREPEVRVLVTPPGSATWMLVHGTADLLSPDEGARAWQQSTAERGVEGVPPTVPTTVADRLSSGKRVIIRVRPSSMSEIRSL
jgi:hypothetical protein